MSCSLYWKPLGNGHQVGDTALRNAIERRYGSRVRLDDRAMDYLQGLADAGIDGATELIKAIEKHGEIEIYQEC